MKHDWKKTEKNYYLPKPTPEIITIPTFNYFTITGQGNPNDDFFADYIGVLYSLGYAVKMSPKSGNPPPNYIDYSVYPLEGIWDINESAKTSFNGTLDKNTLVFKLMIRQPEFVTLEVALQIITTVKKKKPNKLLEKIQFEAIEDGTCVQMLHLGSYDREPESFKQMSAFCVSHNLVRKTKRHREIYLSDARKTAPEKLKTVLRFEVVPSYEK